MKLALPQFGIEETEVDPATLIEFPDGLPGLEHCTRFKLFHAGDNPVIFWLQSINDPLVVFSLVGPESLGLFYKMSLTDEELAILQVDASDLLQVAIILTRGDENDIGMGNPVQANYKSPIIINVNKQIALQKPLNDSEFSIHAHPMAHKEQQEMLPEMPFIPQLAGAEMVCAGPA